MEDKATGVEAQSSPSVSSCLPAKTTTRSVFLKTWVLPAGGAKTKAPCLVIYPSAVSCNKMQVFISHHYYTGSDVIATPLLDLNLNRGLCWTYRITEIHLLSFISSWLQETGEHMLYMLEIMITYQSIHRAFVRKYLRKDFWNTERAHEQSGDNSCFDLPANRFTYYFPSKSCATLAKIYAYSAHLFMQWTFCSACTITFLNWKSTSKKNEGLDFHRMIHRMSHSLVKEFLTLCKI